MDKVKFTSMGLNGLQNVASPYWFRGLNYWQWSNIWRTLKGRSRLDHINGGGLRRNDPNFEIWDNEHSLIKTWM